jgi:hypothetical protein
MNLNITPKKDIEQKAGSLQKILASILGSTVLALWISYFDWFVGIFKVEPKILDYLRIGIACFGLITTCFIGIQSIVWLVGRLIEFKQNYQELIELKKEKDEK